MGACHWAVLKTSLKIHLFPEMMTGNTIREEKEREKALPTQMASRCPPILLCPVLWPLWLYLRVASSAILNLRSCIRDLQSPLLHQLRSLGITVAAAS